MAVKSKTTTGELGRWAFITVIGAIVCVWCVYDGFLLPPDQIGTVTKFSKDTKNATLTLTSGSLQVGHTVYLEWPEGSLTVKLGELKVGGESVKDVAVDRSAGQKKDVDVTLPSDVPAGAKVLKEYENKSFSQAAMVAAAVVFVFGLYKIVASATFSLEARDDGLSVKGGAPIPWSAFTGADTSRIAKGIVTISYATESGPSGSIKLDDYKMTDLRDLIEEINSHTDLNIELPSRRSAAPPSKDSGESDEPPASDEKSGD